MVEKSPQAFRTISEVADVIEVPAHVLRFWESKFTQIKPVKRGGGRRYYRPSDVELIRGIRELLYSDGLTIKGAQKVLRDNGVKHVAEMGAEAMASNAPPPPIDETTEKTSEAEAETAPETLIGSTPTADKKSKPAAPSLVQRDYEVDLTTEDQDRVGSDSLVEPPHDGEVDLSHPSLLAEPDLFSSRRETSDTNELSAKDLLLQADLAQQDNDANASDDASASAKSDQAEASTERDDQLRDIYKRLQSLRTTMTDS